MSEGVPGTATRNPPTSAEVGGFFVAVPVGFEPTVGFHPHNFSRVAPSAARTRHRGRVYVTTRGAANPARRAVSADGADDTLEELGRILRYGAGNLKYNDFSTGTASEVISDSTYAPVGEWRVVE